MNHQEEGNQALKKGDLDLAMELYTKGIEESPQSFQLYSNRSLVHLKKQQYKQALDDAIKAIQIAPDWVKGYYRKASALVELKKYGLAYKTIKEGLEISQIADLLNLKMKVLQNIKIKFQSSPFVRYTNRPILYYHQIPYSKIPLIQNIKINDENAKQLGFTNEHSSPLCSMIRDEEHKLSLSNIYKILLTIEKISIDDLIMIFPLGNIHLSKGNKILDFEKISKLLIRHLDEFFLISEIILEKLEKIGEQSDLNCYDELIIFETFNEISNQNEL